MPDVNKSVSINFTASTQNLEQNLKKIPDITDKEMSKAAKQIDKNFKDIEKTAKKTHRFLSEDAQKTFAKYAAGITAPIAATVLLQQRIADLTNELVDASAKSGIAVDTLAGLRLAAQGAGLEFGGLADSLNQFQVQIADAAADSGNIKLFERLGVDVKDASGALRASDDVFNDTIKSLGQMDNEVERNAIALKLLGEAGGAGLIQSGALTNLQAMSDLATQFGISVEQDAVQSMATFQRRVAEFTTVATGELQRVIDSVAGANSLNAGIEFVTKSVVYMGSLTRDTLALLGQGFENLFVIAQASYMAMTGDVERAHILMKENARENNQAVENMADAFGRANERVAEFERLSSASTAPAKMSATAQATTQAQTAMQGLSQASKEVTENIDLIAEFLNDAILKNVELEQQVRDRLTPEYTKQVNAIKELGVEIDDQIASTEAEVDVLIDAAQARALSVKEQNQLLLLADELDGLESTAALNRKAELKEMQALISEMHADRIAKIEKEKKAQIDAQMNAIKAVQENITTVADLGTSIVSTVTAISDAISAVNERQIDALRDKTDEELKAIDKMVKEGVITAEQAANRRAGIEANYSEQVQEYKLKEFKINQAAAVSNIAFDTARAIAQALGLPPAVRGATIAAVTAAGAAQTAVVLAQKPPKFDVGGMVGSANGAPDTVQANLLTGEAVLDRATVDRLGGAEGIRRLQAGISDMSAPIIIQPFKHIDRYNRALSRQTPRRVGSGAY